LSSRQRRIRGVGVGQGLSTLGLGRAREVVDGQQGLIVTSHLLEHAPGLRFGRLSEGGAHVRDRGQERRILLAPVKERPEVRVGGGDGLDRQDIGSPA